MSKKETITYEMVLKTILDDKSLKDLEQKISSISDPKKKSTAESKYQAFQKLSSVADPSLNIRRDTIKALRDFSSYMVKVATAANEVSPELAKSISALESAKADLETLKNTQTDIRKKYRKGSFTEPLSQPSAFRSLADKAQAKISSDLDVDSLLRIGDKQSIKTSAGVNKRLGYLETKANKDNIESAQYEFLKTLNEMIKEEIKSDSSQVNSLNEQIAQAEKNVLALQSSYDKLLSNNIKANPNLKASNTIDKKADQLSDISNAKVIKETENLPKDIKNLGEKSTSTWGRAFQAVTVYGLAVRSLKRIYSEAISTITTLDKALTEQAMVSGMTKKQTYELLNSYQALATQLGATTTEVTTVATEYLRQGKSAEEALTLTEAAVSAAKVASISTSDSVDYLTTALNGFNMAAEEAIKVSDRFAALAASSATSYNELATALSKVASQANLAGMSMDYTLGLLAKGIETTREPAESIGTALKTVIARMREITDYGATLDDNIDLNNVASQLAYVGISLKNITTGELRSTEEVLDDLGRKWDQLTINQQAAIAKALAGTRQQSRLIAMMQDYDRTLELVSISEKSAGATNAQMSKYLEGVEAALNKLQAAYQKFITSISDSEVIVWLIDYLTNLVGVLEEMAPLLIGLIISFIALKGLISFASIIVSVAMAWKAYSVTTFTATLAQKGLNAAIFACPYVQVALGVAALAVGVFAIVKAARNWKTEVDKTTESLQKLANENYDLNNKNSNLKNIISQYEDLDNQIIKTKEDLESMNELLDSSSVSKYLNEEQQGIYNTLVSEELKIQFLQQIIAENQKAIMDNNREMIRQIDKTKDKNSLFNEIETKNSVLSVALDKLDSLNLDSEYKNLFKSIIGNIDTKTLYNNLNSDDLFNLFSTLDTNKLDILTGKTENASIMDQVNAFQELRNALSGNTVVLEAFDKEYNNFIDLLNLNNQTGIVEWADAWKVSAKELNDFADILIKMGLNVDQVFSQLAQGVPVSAIIDSLNLSEEDKKKLQSGFSSLLQGGGVESIGQGLTTFYNKYQNLYKDQVAYATASAQEQARILNDNAALLEDEETRNAFFNMQDLSGPLSRNNEEVKRLIQEQLTTIEKALMSDTLSVAQRNFLEEQRKNLLDENKTFLSLSLETQLEYQENMLNSYTSYLDKENEALIKSLNKRKDAYQDYFDTINKQIETEDYLEDVSRISGNIAKLSGSTDSTSLKKIADLQEELKELNKERVEKMRQEAQDKTLDDIDKEINNANENLDDIKENTAKMVSMLTSTVGMNYVGSIFASTLTDTKLTNEAKKMWLQDFLSKNQNWLGSLSSGQISYTQNEGNDTTTKTDNTYIFNIGDKTFTIGGDNYELGEAIISALTKMGLQ